MKVLVSVLIMLVSISLCHGQGASDIVKWDSTSLDLGELNRGDKAERSYHFTNISDNDVQIDIVSTCDCTEAKWTQGVIPPNGKGYVNFVFDSSKKDHEETIDVDVYFLNINPKNKNPYSSFLSYTFKFKQ